MPPTVRAKFVCNSKTEFLSTVWEGNQPKPGKVWQYKFYVVTSGSEENKAFFASTPTGSIELSSVRDNLFELGKEYYLDFTPSAVEAKS